MDKFDYYSLFSHMPAAADPTILPKRSLKNYKDFLPAKRPFLTKKSRRFEVPAGIRGSIMLSDLETDRIYSSPLEPSLTVGGELNPIDFLGSNELTDFSMSPKDFDCLSKNFRGRAQRFKMKHGT
jgi:hypothetical protein